MKNKFIFIVLMCFGLIINAQTKPRLFLIGDSTMADKDNPSQNPETGWGQVLPAFFKSDFEIQNHAVNGRSTKSFMSEGRWEKVYHQLKKGDFVVIEFGHNDQKDQDSMRFTNPFTQYRANLEMFVLEARKKGAVPILMTSIVRRNFNEKGVFIDTHGNYPLVVRLVADDLKVPFVDMQLLTEQLEVKYGPVNSAKLHLHYAIGENPYYPNGKDDDTHLSKFGANLVAELAVSKLKILGIGLEKYIK